jgi:hypothetical protein
VQFVAWSHHSEQSRILSIPDLSRVPAHNSVLREAALDEVAVPIPWLGNLPVKFAFA